MRSPHLYDTLRRFCLGAFASFHGADLPFAFEEHGTYGRPTLYEYRPLARGFVEARVDRLYARDDVRSAVDDLQREPAARIFARAHEGVTHDEARALYRSVLVPLLVRTAEGCGGFDWDDQAFDRAYAELEESLFGDGHAYGAVAPLIGVSCGSSIDLGGGIRVRAGGGAGAAVTGRAAAASRGTGTASTRGAAGAGHTTGAGCAGRSGARRMIVRGVWLPGSRLAPAGRQRHEQRHVGATKPRFPNHHGSP